jgi:hypothetical protein
MWVKGACLDIARGPPTICITMDVWGFAELHYSVWLTNVNFFCVVILGEISIFARRSETFAFW